VEIDTQSWLATGDGNCCPTAGRADLTLGLRDGW
jgi:hypothetical protein